MTFGTDIIPIKSRTKCLAFVKKKKELRCMLLNDKILPWVHSVRHLGTTVTTDFGCKTNQDLAEKRAAYISRNNEVVQEFLYAHPKTKIWTNSV